MRDSRPIAEVRGLQILFQPALLPDLNGVIDIPVIITHRGLGRARQTIACRDSGDESEKEILGGILGLDDWTALQPHSIDGGIGEKFHLIADVERFVGDTFQSCFFLEKSEK